MPGMFGDDFDVTRPEDSSAVKHGASWIRDIKARLKRFLAVMFNLETGVLKNDVIGSEMLKDIVTPGTYTEVTVNSKGLVTAGANPVEQKVARTYRAIFPTGVSPVAVVEEDGGLVSPNLPPAQASAVYASASPAPYKGVYAGLEGSQYTEYTFTIPTGVRRIKAIIVGGGGGKHTGAGTPYGGAGGELVETILDVDQITSITVLVGMGGSGGDPGAHGGPSGVIVSASVYAEAGGGGGGSGSAAGVAVAGDKSTANLNVLAIPGADGANGAGGESGSYYRSYGRGGPDEAADPDGDHGVVILEWVL